MTTTTSNNFMCPRCGYETTRKSNILQHFQRKIPCPATKENILLEDVRSHFLKEREKLTSEKVYHCSECQASFTTAQGLSRHRHHYCKKNKESEMEMLKRKTEELERKLELAMHDRGVVNNTNNTVNNTNTNTNNIIQICAFGQEDASRLLNDARFMERCLIRRELGMVDYLQRLHFDPSHPEHHNLRVTNYKLPYIDQFDGSRWKKAEKEEILEDMLDGSCSSFDEHYQENKHDIATRVTENMMRMINEFVDHLKDREANAQLFLDLKKKIYLMMINESRQLQSQLIA